MDKNINKIFVKVLDKIFVKVLDKIFRKNILIFMVLKILSIEGGGILGVKFLIGILKLSEQYEKKNIDFLNLFDVFTGVSSGAIISASLALREKILANIAKTDDKMITDILKKSGYEGKRLNEVKKQIRNQKLKNCSKIIVNFLIYLFKNKSNEIFVLNKNKTTIMDSKYTGDKINVFKKYINYDLKDVPKNRYLILKTFNLQEMTINVFSNYSNDANGNKYSTNVAEIIHWSSNAPTYFPNNGVQIDGGNFINSTYYSEKKLFSNVDLIVFSIGSRISKLKIPNIDQKYQWVNGIINVLYNVGKQIDKYTNDKYHHLGFDLKHYQLDDISIIDEIMDVAYKIEINEAISFINNHIIQ